MARLRRFLDGLLALALMLAGEREEPTPQAVETLLGLVLGSGPEALERVLPHVDRSKAGELHNALRAVSVRLGLMGREEDAHAVLKLWAWGAL